MISIIVETIPGGRSPPQSVCPSAKYFSKGWLAPPAPNTRPLHSSKGFSNTFLPPLFLEDNKFNLAVAFFKFFYLTWTFLEKFKIDSPSISFSRLCHQFQLLFSFSFSWFIFFINLNRI